MTTEIENLITEIENESGIGANTKTRIASVLRKISNEARPFKVYTALISQTGTDAPVATILENTLGFIPVWQYLETGRYQINNNSLFDNADKVVVFTTAKSNINNDKTFLKLSHIQSRIEFRAGEIESNSRGSYALYLNDRIQKASLEIRVYN